ncbi:TetR/AcrR family transcriptional regulator [Myceligenerans pegani]|uniref:TetR/AcrR family transcriptional regulator n=1 Tax=Myceligenerans pegani TaxID=2776917 RepID=A0ABR9MXT4_9MICO|nr:TetR/AcrR family transcriptional regulator [Myceligenerans sp. TRM 65318]MBE1876196.1 TetR/AcrR family transcriptional regulator [Myceligenerans sp. TRM 65318]MBE3018467.1 TetR/AcrR family transcriptional regulator [Myceligenerans sp. TRM 65318]
MTEAPTRRDAARNRERLVAAARRVFADLGPDAPLEEIARTAGVSRTTLHRHFADRPALVSAVMWQNVVDIETEAAKLSDADDGAVRLFHFMHDMQRGAPWLALVVTPGGDVELRALGDLAERTASALEPLLARAREAGLTHPSVTTQHVLLTLPMAMAVQAAETSAGLRPPADATREILHRGLFTTDPPGTGRPGG